MNNRIGTLVLLVALGGCGTGAVGALPPVTSTSPSTFALQLAVGTARIGNPSGGSVVGLNVVATFRAPGGQNATLANTPSLTGPAVFDTEGTPSNTLSAPLPTDILSAASSKSPAPPPGALGSLIGVYGYGFAPLNIVALAPNQAVYAGQTCDGFVTSSLISTSIRYDQMAMPLDFLAGCLPIQNPYQPLQWFGGPPAWPSPSGYGIPTGDPTTGEYFHGYPFGFMDFADVKPAVGPYTLNVQFAANSTGTQFDTQTATATLASSTTLPAIAPPTLTVNSDGSGTVLLTVPAGVSEAIVDIAADYCQATTLSTQLVHYYSLYTTQTGTQSLPITNNLGPPDSNGNPTDTFCTAADDAKTGIINHHYTIAVAGFDYPAFEASYPQSTALTPIIANSAGQADITTSVPTTVTYTPSSQALPTSRSRARRR